MTSSLLPVPHSYTCLQASLAKLACLTNKRTFTPHVKFEHVAVPIDPAERVCCLFDIASTGFLVSCRFLHYPSRTPKLSLALALAPPTTRTPSGQSTDIAMRMSTVAAVVAACTTIQASAVQEVLVPQTQSHSLSVDSYICSSATEASHPACQVDQDVDGPALYTESASNSTGKDQFRHPVTKTNPSIDGSTTIVARKPSAASSKEGASGGAFPQQMQGSIVGLLGFCIVGLVML